jgi:hypothetical protein
MAEGDTFVNAVLGAVATLVLTPLVPFAPVLGGLVAGYLEGRDRDAGLRVGAVSGAVALIPLVLVGFFAANVFLFFVDVSMGPGWVMGGFGILALAFVVVFAAVYTVGLSALGGWLGNYVKYDTDIGSG